MRHFLTFDLEHWYEGYRYREIGGWEGHAKRDHITVERLLRILEEHGVKATFFTTGRFADDFSELVYRIAETGHEIASHSYSHQLVTQYTALGDFATDLEKSLAVLRQIAGPSVIGFRAPKWSLPSSQRVNYYRILQENGLRYDSSLYPIGRIAERFPFRVDSCRDFWEIPAGTLAIGGFNIPAAGGLWLRLWPEIVATRTLRQAERQGQPGTVYLHPYDLDEECPRLSLGMKPGLRLFGFARSYRLNKAEPILRQLLTKFHFHSVRDWLTAI